jgi:hypothetical protein
MRSVNRLAGVRQLCTVPGEPARAAYERVRYAWPHVAHVASQSAAEVAGGSMASEAALREPDDAPEAGVHVNGAPHS